MELQLFSGDTELNIRFERDGNRLKLSHNGSDSAYELVEISSGHYLLKDGHRTHRIVAIKEKNKVHVLTDSESYTFELPASKDEDTFGADHGAHGDKSKVYAPMPGKVVKVLVEAGQEVEPKQKLVIVEAMKMENPLVAPFKAKVVAVNCEAGELVDTDKLLIELEELE